ncbi:helix-turn-helix transcriptional regulator [Crossiella cryophila]|uniref:DNA-binding CsgD family transcriptional regulator n=1 Tax=Crossiella cryophila TaxID=43355 RepID=A0A7W7CJC0_9PSEU|nr:helix-turn-helix transcriptional regulator [Crossiella cryophila]MBB4682022.1 DNA-binding CsgD family transcriptional regulator [Crossiella cryophila]
MNSQTPVLSLLRPADRAPAPTSTAVDTQLAGATREVLVARRGNCAFPRPLATFRKIDHDNLRRGVRYRVLVTDQTRTAPGASLQLSALALAGAEVRTLPEVPMDAFVIDGSVAVLPADGADGYPGRIAMFRLAGVVRTTTELFERVWPAAVPLIASELPEAAELTVRERELLTLLFDGCTDESVAARLRISVRTVRRMVSDIMNRLGARSRFQAGAKAADRGWLMDRVG